MPDRCPCGKVGYSSERAARMANKTVGFRIRTYRCEASRHWHVSNAEKRGLMKRDRPLED